MNNVSDLDILLSGSSGDNYISIGFSSGSVIANKFGTASSMKNSWQHLAFSMTTSNSVSVYANGTLKNTFTSSLSCPANTSQAQFIHDGNITAGTTYTSAYTSLKGYVDDYRIYNGVLSAAEILRIYSE
jgi:hypothetical protein